MQLSRTKNLILIFLLLSVPALSFAEKKKQTQGPPPMLVEVTSISQGMAEPMVDLVGTIKYARVSRVAAEIGGIVEHIDIKEGARVNKGQTLVKLNNDLRQTTLAGTRANYEQTLIELEKSRKDLKRIAALYEKKSVAETLYDDNFYRVLSMEKKSLSLKATLSRQQLELKKTTIKAPFDGLIQSKLTEQGEWVSGGGQVAVIADDRDLEAHIEVSQKLLGYLQADKPINVTCAGTTYRASFINFIPRGDIATRTFTVKLKLDNATGLIAGMEAKAQLPNGPKIGGLLVPRDAVINQFGRNIIFIADNGIAKMIPVQIRGYQGMQVSVENQALTAGAQVVVKGSERIRDGQAIRF